MKGAEARGRERSEARSFTAKVIHNVTRFCNLLLFFYQHLELHAMADSFSNYRVSAAVPRNLHWPDVDRADFRDWHCILWEAQGGA